MTEADVRVVMPLTVSLSADAQIPEPRTKTMKTMKTRAVMALMIVGCLLAGGAGAQMAPGTQGSPKAGQANKAEMTDAMMKKCKTVMAEREGMMTHMKAMEATLDQLVATMRVADRDHKLGAMSAVIEEMVAQRKAMREMNESMAGQMMAHMMEHMRPDAPASMADCPMMKTMATKAVTPHSDGHPTHH